MQRINVIQHSEVSGVLQTIYTTVTQKRGRLSEVLKIQSLHPQSMQSHLNFYIDIISSKTCLSGAEKEMIAVVVSAANGCLYCKTHHVEALNLLLER